MKEFHITDFSSLLDNGLSPDEEKRCQEHLKRCPSCREKFETLSAIVSESKGLKSFPVSPFFASKVLAKAREQKSESLWSAFDLLPRPLVYALLMASVIIIGFIAAPAPVEETAIEPIDPLAETDLPAISSDEEALQFALNGIENLPGEENGF